MAIIVITPNPASLLESIKKEIDAGKIATWAYDDDGDFTHTPDQWTKKAWLSIIDDQLEMALIPNNNG